MEKPYLKLSAMTALILGIYSTAAAGTSADDAVAPAPATKESGIETVVITAEHRKQSLQKTSISVTALSAETLAQQAVTSVDAALRDVAGVVVQGTANGGGIFIRGIGSGQDAAIGGPSVNLNVDGIYQQQPEVPLSAIYDVERIEVLRGPQGTIYGRNANAGSVNIITANPTSKFEGRGSVGYGNFNLLHTEAVLNVPVTDKVAIRAATSTERRKGYLQPSGYNDADQQSGRIKVLARPTKDLSILLAGEYLHVGGEGVGGVDTLSLHPDDPWASTAPAGVKDITSKRLYGQIDWNFGPALLTVIPAHQSFYKYDANVIINNPVATTATVQTVDETQDTLEARLTSTGSGDLKWVAGLYYLDSSARFSVPASRIALPASPAVYPYVYGNSTNSKAAFVQLTYALTPAMRLIGGLRQTKDEKTSLKQASANAVPIPVDGDWKSTTYKAGVEADLARNAMLYANVSTGFKAGGIDQGFIVYQPEKIKALALGAKSRLFDNTVQINGEAFHYKYDNFQAQYGYRCMNTAYCSPVQTYANRIVNAGNATVYGAELEAVWRPTPDDRIEANVAYLHSVFDKLVISAGTSSACATPGASTVCALQPDQILTDQPLANAPKGSGSLAYEHIFTLPNSGELSVRAGTHLFSPYWTNYRRPPQVSAETYVRSYHKSDLFITYTAPQEKWRVLAWVKNIENRAVVTTAIGPTIQLQPPRTFGVTLSANF